MYAIGSVLISSPVDSRLMENYEQKLLEKCKIMKSLSVEVEGVKPGIPEGWIWKGGGVNVDNFGDQRACGVEHFGICEGKGSGLKCSCFLW